MEKEISNIILNETGKKYQFRLKYGWFSFRLSVKTITAKRLLKISAELSQVKEANQLKELFPAFIENISDIKHIAKAIAISTGSPFQRIVTSGILRLPVKDIQTLTNILIEQTDMERFFFILISLKGMTNLLKATGPQ